MGKYMYLQRLRPAIATYIVLEMKIIVREKFCATAIYTYMVFRRHRTRISH